MQNETDRRREYSELMDRGLRATVDGDTMQALDMFRRALTLASNDAERAHTRCMVGRCYGTMGDFKSAEIALMESLQLASGIPTALGRVKFELGTVRWQQGQLDAAKQFLSQAVSELRGCGDHVTWLRALGNLGLVLQGRGEYQAAITTIKSAVELAESTSNWPYLSINLSNLGEGYQELGDLNKARELHERALAVVREHGLGEGAQIDLVRNLGVDLLGLGQVDQAVQVIEQALALARRHHRHDLELQVLHSLGEAYLARGECDRAKAIALQLIEAADGIPSRLAGARLILGRCYLEQNNPQQAILSLSAGLIDAQTCYSKLLILRLHAALGQVVTHEAIAQVHRRIAAELVQQIADALDDKALRDSFLQSPLARSVL